LLISIEKNKADRLVERIKEEGFEDATVIGEVVESPRGVIEIVP
ncbi:MAG: selenide, water dikinase SelD, partial [Candidatus Coatesbacteria bacterium]